MNYQNLPNDDGEVLSLEDEKVRTIIAELKRVDAPKDFDFRLKARIAKSKSTEYKSGFLPVLRYVLPLSAVLVISAFVILNGLYFPNNQVVPKVVESIPQPKIEKVNSPVLSPTVTPLEIASDIPKDVKSVTKDLPAKNEQTKTKQNIRISEPDTQFVVVKSPTVDLRKNPAVKEVKNNNGGGSRDSASSSPINILPSGINLNSTPEKLSNTGIKQPLNTKEILSQLGIEALFTDVGWMTKSIKKDSLADKSGVKAGDVVEAINGKKLTDKLLNAETIEVKNLTIMRGGEKIEIPANQ